MKRALRNTETAMFVKFDGGETQSIDTARCFLNYDEAVAFCKAKNLGAVELVVHTDDQSEYTLSVPTKYLAPGEEDDATAPDVQHSGPSAEAEVEPAFHESRTSDSESNAGAALTAARDAQIAFAGQAPEVDLEADTLHSHITCTECHRESPVETEALPADVDEWDAAISSYAQFEISTHQPEFHFNPPAACDVCGVELKRRWFFVDGRIAESGEWRDICSHCFFTNDGKIGPGKGRLYQRLTDGRWLLVGGFGISCVSRASEQAS